MPMVNHAHLISNARRSPAIKQHIFAPHKKMAVVIYLWSSAIEGSVSRAKVMEELRDKMETKGVDNVTLRAFCIEDPRVRKIIAHAKYKVTQVPCIIVKDGKDVVITHRENEISSFFGKINKE
jgi:hypothetical protein